MAVQSPQLELFPIEIKPVRAEFRFPESDVGDGSIQIRSLPLQAGLQSIQLRRADIPGDHILDVKTGIGVDRKTVLCQNGIPIYYAL